MSAGSDTGTRLAFERTYLAHERTQMAWVRTGLALISFGFGIAKFFEFLHAQQGQKPPLLGASAVGMLMIGTGLVSLMLATVQHGRAMRVLRTECPDLPRSIAGTAGVLIILLGVLAFAAAAVRQFR